MVYANAGKERTADKQDEQSTIGTIFLRRGKISRRRRKAPMTFLLLLIVWSSLSLAVRPASLLLSTVAAASTHKETIVNAASRRRCIGQFLEDYTAISTDDVVEGEGKEEKSRQGSVLHWLHENTSCGLPPEPSVPSKKRKKKETNHKNDESEMSSMAASFDSEGSPYHIVILLMEDHPIRHEIVTLSAGFLAAGLKVTIFSIYQDSDTIGVNQANQTMADLIRSEIFERMPWNENIIERARENFQSVEVYLNDPAEPSICKNNIEAAHPLDKCAIEMAPAVLKLLRKEIGFHIPPDADETGAKRFDFVLMMDASFLGGLLFSEIEMIPSVVIGSHHTLMFAIEQGQNWSPSPNRMTLDRIDRIFLQRLYSFGLTGVFLRANRMRQSLGLPRLERFTSPLDHFLPVAAVLVDLVPSDFPLVRLASSYSSLDSGQRDIFGTEDARIDGKGYGYRVHNIQPLLSPCNICLDEDSPSTTATNSTVTIMVAPPASVSAKWTRSLIRALSITKHSLQGYDDCLFDRATCRNRVVGFEVDWLTTNDKEDDPFPPVIPSFIRRQGSVSLLDSAIRNPNTVIALIHCDSGSNILATFGIEVYCISQSDRIPTIYSVGDLLEEKGYIGAATSRGYPPTLLEKSVSRETISPEEVATQLLSVLRRQSVGLEAASAAEWADSTENGHKQVADWISSGLQRSLTIVQSAARVHRENVWANPRQMQLVTSSAITKALRSVDFVSDTDQVDNRQDAGSKQNFFGMFTVFVAWVVFLSATIYIILKDSIAMKRWRQHRHHLYQRNGGSIIDSILNRLNDLDNTWDMLLSWSSNLTLPNLGIAAHGDGIGRVKTNENAATNTRKEHHQQNSHNNNQHHGQMRRRRKMKTTR